MFWKWGGKNIKIYGEGVIEGQGYALSRIVLAPQQNLTRITDSAGGTNLRAAQDRKLLSLYCEFNAERKRSHNSLQHP